jgi:hypothetical protein
MTDDRGASDSRDGEKEQENENTGGRDAETSNGTERGTSEATRDATRRDVLKITGSTALATSLAGCPDGESADGSSPFDDNATSSSDGGSYEEPKRYAINPPEVVEDATQLERAVFTDMYGEPVETPVAGVEVPSYIVSYGHDAGSGRTEYPAQLAAGVVSTPAGGGENALASMPFEELLVAEEGGAFRRAIGLEEDPAFVQQPLHLGTEEGTALDRDTETQAFLVAIEGQDVWAQGVTQQMSGSGVGVATVYTMRVTVGSTAVLLGMVDGAGLPTGRTPAPGSVGPEDLQRVAEFLEQLNRMALMWEAVSALARLGCSLEDQPPAPERRRNEVALESSSAGLTADGQKALGYPTEDTGSLSNGVTYTVGRTDWGLCEDWNEETFSPGTRYDWDIETRMRTYTVGGDDTFPVGVITSPKLQRHGAERNPLVSASLESLLTYGLEELGLYDTDNALDWVDGPNERADRSGKLMLGYHAEVKLFGGTVGQIFSSENPDKEVEIHVARVTTDTEVVIALLANVNSTKGYWNERSRATELFNLVLVNQTFGPSTPDNWNDIEFNGFQLVQKVSDTKVVDGSNTIAKWSDPDVVTGENVTPVFGLKGPSMPIRTVFETTTASRSGQMIFEADRAQHQDLASPSPPNAIVFHRLANHINGPNTDPPVFKLRTGDDSVSLSARAPSGYTFDTQTFQEGEDYDMVTVPPLKAGFIILKDSEDGARYGDSGGFPQDPFLSWSIATQYLEKVYPGPVASYYHQRNVIAGGSGGYGTFCEDLCVIRKDMKNVYWWLNGVTSEPAFPDDGDLRIIGAGQDQTINWSNGFDVVVAIVPGVATQNDGVEDYYDFWGQEAVGLEMNDPGTAVSAAGTAPDRDTKDVATTVAHEIGHYFQDDYLDSSASNPMAQRRNKDDVDDQTVVDGKPIVPAHARHQNSTRVEGGDAPGLVSTGFHLEDGFSLVKEFDLTNNLFSFQGPAKGATSAPELPSYMSYSDKNSKVWSDAVIHQQLINNSWNYSGGSGSSASGYKLSATGNVNDEGEVQYDDVSTRPGPATLTDMEDADIEVELLGPDGSTVLERVRVPRTIEVHEYYGQVEPTVDAPSFTLPFDDRGVTVRTTLEGQEATMNPIVRCVGDAVRRVPEDAFTGDRAEALSTIDNALEDVAAAMDGGAYGDAASAMDGTVRTRIDSALGAYETQALNVPSRGELSDLVDEMVRRLEGLSGGDPDSGTDIPLSRDRWEVLTGDWEFQNDQILQTRSATGNVILAKDVTLQDGTFAAEMNAVDGKKGANLIWRADGDFRSNYYRFGPLTLGPSSQEVAGGTESRLIWDLIQGGGFPGPIEIAPVEETPVDVGVDEFHDYRVEFEGTTHRLYVDDQLVFEGTDDRLTEYDRIGFHVGHTVAIRNIRFSR